MTEKYNKWTIVKHLSEKIRGRKAVLVRCDCGVEKKTPLYSIKNGLSTQCRSCARKNQNVNGMRTHGDSSRDSDYFKLYQCWKNMKTRCYNESCTHYNVYGGRGIQVCDQWKESYEKFKSWSLENSWTLGLSIDRINPDLNYEPSNCRWVSLSENSRLANAHNIQNQSGAFTDESKVKSRKWKIDNLGIKVKVLINEVWEEFDSLSLAAERLSGILNRSFSSVYSQCKQCLNEKSRCKTVGGYKIEKS